MALAKTTSMKDKPPVGNVHSVYYYRHERDVLDVIIRTIVPTLERGGVALCVIDRPFRTGVQRWLRAQKAEGNTWAERCVVVGASATLWSLTLRRAMDDPRFKKRAENLVQGLAGRGNGEIAVAAQVASVLWRRRGPSRAMQFEKQWDALCKRLEFPLLCLYPIEALESADAAGVNAGHDHAWTAS